MLFYSYEFILVFLPVVVLAYWAISRVNFQAAKFFLLLASFYFYGSWKWDYLALLVITIAVNYVLALWLERFHDRRLLWLALAINLAGLGYFKYCNFGLGVLCDLGLNVQFRNSLLLPLGISFFTFQQIAYVVDVWRGEKAERSLINYSLFVSFFPQLVAGPIIRLRETLPQIRSAQVFRLTSENLAVGGTIFVAGLFKKIVVADHMALYATPLFEAAARGAHISMFEAWGAALAYTFQIYFDFSGYSDMAIGLGRILGIRLPINFDSPYKSTSVTEFWRRWHVSMSFFFRDYIYIPLGGGRRGLGRGVINSLATFTLVGLWHGAGWTFILWGGMHGAFLAVNRLWRRLRGRDRRGGPWARALGWLLTFLCVVVGWVFFRAADMATGLKVVKAMFAVDAPALLPLSYAQASGWVEAVGRWLGIGFAVPDDSVLAYWRGIPQMAWLGACLLWCLVLPNTQQWMRLHQPTVDEVPTPGGFWGRLAWQPRPLLGLGVGCLLLFVVYLHWYLDIAPEFIYFNF